MFNSITWGQYFIALTLLLVCYYLFIGLQYFRWEILGLIGIKKVDDKANNISAAANLKNYFEGDNHEDYLPKSVLEIDISPVVQSFTDEVKAFMQQLDSRSAKNELLHSIAVIVLKYPVLKNADCKQELVQFLCKEINAKYPGLLQLNDVQGLLT